jgi:hypothetical protein
MLRIAQAVPRPGHAGAGFPDASFPGTSLQFHRYQFHSTPDQFRFILDAKCHLKLYAFG